MNGQRQSDRCVVPWKAANKGGAGAQLAEWPEGRDLPKGESSRANQPPNTGSGKVATSAGEGTASGQER